MKKINSLLLASLLLVGCASTPKPEPTPTATPESTLEAKDYIVITSRDLTGVKAFSYGYYIVNNPTPAEFCKVIEDDDKIYERWIITSGEIEIVNNIGEENYTEEAIIEADEYAKIFVKSVEGTCLDTLNNLEEKYGK